MNDSFGLINHCKSFGKKLVSSVEFISTGWLYECI